MFIVLRDLVPYLTAIDLESLNGERKRQALVSALRELVLDDLRRWDGEDFSEGVLTTLRAGTACWCWMDWMKYHKMSVTACAWQ